MEEEPQKMGHELHRGARRTRSAPRAWEGFRGGSQLATHKIKDDLPAQLEVYIGGLILGQGRFAGQPFPLQAWERKFLRGAFSQSGDAAMSLARGGGKTSFCAGIACAAVDVDGPLSRAYGGVHSHCLQLRSRVNRIQAYVALSPAVF